MKAVLIVQTESGFAAVRFDAEALTVDVSKLICFGELGQLSSYRHEGVLAAVKAYLETENKKDEA